MCLAYQVKFEFGGNFGGQKAQKCKILKSWIVFGLGKTVVHKGVKFGTGFFLTRIYNFVL